MGPLTQILHLCAATVFFGGVLWAIRGVPAPDDAQAGAVACTVGEEGTGSIGWISPPEARLLLERQDVTFVDCRSRDHFLAGHVSGALSVPADEGLPSEVLELLKRFTTVVTYCDADGECANSQRMASLFSAGGVQDVRVLKGGLPAWLARQYPAESGTCRTCVSAN